MTWEGGGVRSAKVTESDGMGAGGQQKSKVTDSDGRGGGGSSKSDLKCRYFFNQPNISVYENNWGRGGGGPSVC